MANSSRCVRYPPPCFEGCIVPLSFITPHLKFYPPKLPIIILDDNKIYSSHYNEYTSVLCEFVDCSAQRDDELPPQCKMKFIQKLMRKLNMKYFIPYSSSYLYHYYMYGNYQNRLKINSRQLTYEYEDKHVVYLQECYIPPDIFPNEHMVMNEILRKDRKGLAIKEEEEEEEEEEEIEKVSNVRENVDIYDNYIELQTERIARGTINLLNFIMKKRI